MHANDCDPKFQIHTLESPPIARNSFKNRIAFLSKVTLFAFIMYGVAYLQTKILPDNGPTQLIASATMGALIFSLINPFLGPLLEGLYKKARIDSFRSMTGNFNSVDREFVDRLSEYYKRTHSMLDIWGTWTRDDISLLFNRFDVLLNRMIQIYLAHKQISPDDAHHPFSNPRSFHDPLAQALIFFADIYPDYTIEPEFVLKRTVLLLLKGSYFDNKDLNMDLLKVSLEALDPRFHHREKFYNQALKFISASL
jgi:hypothetical protein